MLGISCVSSLFLTSRVLINGVYAYPGRVTSISVSYPCLFYLVYLEALNSVSVFIHLASVVSEERGYPFLFDKKIETCGLKSIFVLLSLTSFFMLL